MSAVIETKEKILPNGNGFTFRKPYRFTVKVYDLLIEHGVFTENDDIELLNGDIIDKMPKGTKHAYFNDLISDFLKERLGKSVIVRNQNPILLDDFSEPEPDVVLTVPPRETYLTKHPTPDDILLIVEVSDSTVNFDRYDKGAAYSRAGIRQYLLVNLENKTVEDYQNPGADGYGSKQTYKIGDVFSLIAFPEIEIKVEDFLQN